MYGVSKINIEPSLMMISVQDAAFKGNTMARYLQIFADTGVVVDMISQSAPHGTSMDFSFTASSSDLPHVFSIKIIGKCLLTLLRGKDYDISFMNIIFGKIHNCLGSKTCIHTEINYFI